MSSILDKDTLGFVLTEFFLPTDFEEFLWSAVFLPPPSNVFDALKSLNALFLKVADWLSFDNCWRSRSFEGSSSRRSMRLCKTCAVIRSLLVVLYAIAMTFWSRLRIYPNFDMMRGSLGKGFLSALLILGWLASVLRVLGPTSAIPGNVRFMCIELF